MTRDLLIKWLLANGYAEEHAGYGHVTAEDLADALIRDGWVPVAEEDGPDGIEVPIKRADDVLAKFLNE